MVKYRSIGDVVELQIPGAGVTKDVPVQIGQLIVIPTVTAAFVALTRFNSITRGIVAEMPKVASQAWTEGQPVYWDAETGKLTSVAGDNHHFGYALQAVANGVGDILSGEVLFSATLADVDETT